jgi:hypothetical protein
VCALAQERPPKRALTKPTMSYMAIFQKTTERLRSTSYALNAASPLPIKHFGAQKGEGKPCGLPSGS